jgi:hypothetical protein
MSLPVRIDDLPSFERLPRLCSGVDYYSWSLAAQSELEKKDLLWTIEVPVRAEPTLQSLLEDMKNEGFNQEACVVSGHHLSEAKKSYRSDLAKAKGILGDLTDASTKPITQHLRSPLEVWNRLKLEFNKGTPDQIIMPLVSLASLRIDQLDGAIAHGNKFVEVMHRIKSMDTTQFTIDNVILGLFLNSLGPTFTQFTNPIIANWTAINTDVSEINRRLATFVTTSQRSSSNTVAFTVNTRTNPAQGRSNKRQRQNTVSEGSSPCEDPRCLAKNLMPHDAAKCFWNKDPASVPNWWKKINGLPLTERMEQ